MAVSSIWSSDNFYIYDLISAVHVPNISAPVYRLPALVILKTFSSNLIIHFISYEKYSLFFTFSTDSAVMRRSETKQHIAVQIWKAATYPIFSTSVKNEKVDQIPRCF
jgi:hypothetical protein